MTPIFLREAENRLKPHRDTEQAVLIRWYPARIKAVRKMKPVHTQSEIVNKMRFFLGEHIFNRFNVPANINQKLTPTN